MNKGVALVGLSGERPYLVISLNLHISLNVPEMWAFHLEMHEMVFLWFTLLWLSNKGWFI